MRIGIVTPYFDEALSTGTAGFEFNLTKGLAKLGHEVTVYTSEKMGPPSIRSAFKFTNLEKKPGVYKIDGYTIKRSKCLLELQVKLSGFPVVPAVFKKILEDDLDIIQAASHEQPLTLLAFIASKVKRTPFTYIHWGYEYPLGAARYALFAYEHTALKPLFMTRKIIAGADVTRDFMVEYLKIPSKRIDVIPHDAINTDLFDPSIYSKEESRQMLGIEEEDYVVLTVAKLYKLKGLDYLLKAFAQFRRARPSGRLKLIIVGAGPEENNLRQLVLQLGIAEDVRLHTKPIPNTKLPYFYSAADVFVLSSLSQQGGAIIKEASSMKLPVISTDVGAIPEIVEDGGSGTLVEPRDVDALRDAMIQIYDNPSTGRKFGEKGREIACQRYSYLQMANQALSIYKSLLKR